MTREEAIDAMQVVEAECGAHHYYSIAHGEGQQYGVAVWDAGDRAVAHLATQDEVAAWRHDHRSPVEDTGDDD